MLEENRSHWLTQCGRRGLEITIFVTGIRNLEQVGKVVQPVFPEHAIIKNIPYISHFTNAWCNAKKHIFSDVGFVYFGRRHRGDRRIESPLLSVY